MSALALPAQPSDVRPAELPVLLSQTQASLASIEAIDVLWDASGRANAISRYLKRSRLHNPEVVYTDLLIRDRIGELLGPAEIGTNQHAGVRHAEPLSKAVRWECRELHQHRHVWINSRPDSVRQALIAIDRAKLADNTPDVAGETTIRCGDFRDTLADIPDGSVDLIFTDPPYAKEFVSAYGELAEFGARVLKPGGSLMAYCGQYALPQILVDMEGALRYWWMCACVHEGGNHKSLAGIKTYVLWKPIVWFVKETNHASEFVYDAILRPAPDKRAHDWQQALDEPLHYIEKLCPPDGLVVDPFAGGGTTLLAAQRLGRRFIGSEIDHATLSVAAGRLAS